MSGTILIVEDEPVLLRVLKDTFVNQGWDVAIASDGEKGLELALAKPADVILLDIMLPRVNGYEICRVVRERGVQSAILMLTAKRQEEDVVLGLNLGADDYLSKPFRRGELIARVNALMRRARGNRAAVAQFGKYELNLAGHKLFHDGKEVELTAKEFRVLAFLATHPGCAVSREEILNAAWGNSVMVTPRSIDRCVATLRAKIEPDPHHPVHIHTVRDIGYRFEGEEQ
jgi:DNA-binding response OmpR family regulator